jgi:hypothetical protein
MRPGINFPRVNVHLDLVGVEKVTRDNNPGDAEMQ